MTATEPAPKERLLQLLIDSVVDYAIFMLDPGGHIMTWNSGAQRIKGYRAEEIIGKHFSVFYPPADVRSAKPEYELRVAAESGRFEDEGWRLRQDGSRFWANVVISAMRDEGGVLVGFAKVTRDLTERRQSEEERALLLQAERDARRSSEIGAAQLQGLQEIAEAAIQTNGLAQTAYVLVERVAELLLVDSVALFLAGEDGFHLLARNGAAHAVRLEPLSDAGALAAATVVGTPTQINDLDSESSFQIFGDDEVRSALGIALALNGEVIGALYIGSRRYRRFSREDVTFVELLADRMATLIDRTRLLESEQAAQAAALAAEQVSRLRERFLGIAAHELRSPLTVVKGNTGLLKRMVIRGTSSTEELLESIAEIEAHEIRLEGLINDLLETARIEEGKLALRREHVDLAALAETIVDRLQRDAAMTASHMLVLDAPHPVEGEWDLGRLDQVLTNLVSNAIKYSPDGGEVRVAVDGDDVEASVAVSDHGIGIHAETLAKLFQPFNQFSPATQREPGIGLGLFICSQLAERHGGSISVESEVGAGSTFTVRLPKMPPPPLAAD